MIERLAAPTATLPTGPARWSPAAVERAMALWATAPSAADVAMAVNTEFGTAFSRRAIISRMHRAGLSHAGPRLPVMLPKGTKGKPKAKRDPATVVKPKPAPKPAAVLVARPAPRPSELPESRRVAITEIGASACRYIAWDPRVDSSCCGHAVEQGSAWCPGHARICTTVSRPRVSSGFALFRRAA
ncbi:GcrA family cell cycle regulator [Methylobacterium sp. WL12]|uniref:GcrA family cell cycle regulator n=1 Tax=Methylobacterium sp. WL12 TaxID=2603890 RepID=UPI001FEF29C5|nr:GcrA family cell cycle regulator [Methylobacterium sp. WL12]